MPTKKKDVQWTCPGCATVWDQTPEFCPKCGTPSDELAFTDAPVTQRVAAVDAPAIVSPRDAAIRVVAVFAIIGLGLAGSILILLWAAGFFGAADSFPGFVRPILSSASFALVFFFALLIGGALAAVGAHYIADRSPTPGEAALAGALGAGVGHLLMVAIVVTTLLVTVYAVVPSAGPTPLVPTPNPSAAAQCVQTFGANSPLCTRTPSPITPSELNVEGGGVTAANIGKLALGAIPTAIVGALTALVLFDRRRRQPATAL